MAGFLRLRFGGLIFRGAGRNFDLNSHTYCLFSSELYFFFLPCDTTGYFGIFQNALSSY